MTFSKTQIKLNSKDSIIDFGKYKGYTVKEVCDVDASYLFWAIKNTNRFSLPDWLEDKIYDKAKQEHIEYFKDNYDPAVDEYDYWD